jgi:hypothetical protein
VNNLCAFVAQRPPSKVGETLLGNRLHIPEKLLPENQPESESIDVLVPPLTPKKVITPSIHSEGKWKAEKKLKKTGRKNADRF